MYSTHSVVQASFVKQCLDCAFGNTATTRPLVYHWVLQQQWKGKRWKSKIPSGAECVEKPWHQPFCLQLLPPALSTQSCEHQPCLQVGRNICFNSYGESLREKLFLQTELMVSSGPAMKVQLFLIQAWAVAFLHLGNWAFPMSTPFYFSLFDRAVVLLTWMSITWEIQTPWGGSTSGKVGGCVWENFMPYLWPVEDTDVPKLTQELKGYLDSLSVLEMWMSFFQCCEIFPFPSGCRVESQLPWV